LIGFFLLHKWIARRRVSNLHLKKVLRVIHCETIHCETRSF